MRQVSQRHAAMNAERELKWARIRQDRAARSAADRLAREALQADREACTGTSDPLAVLKARREARGLPVDHETLLRLLPMAMRKAIVGTRWTILEGRTKPRGR